ncbi:hypothetical protein Misp01_00170 [Microtetraspora sp. NBRC 13810]|uniref:DUF998 domain-containing protein n=1 Tax=Microtetraspora sp. NBRC 13810 TaxID=3030990 RepID=UPI0024A4850A|nr:DUF998 domain-containing protein [Microtetraspora sp. NBRC 13810]GLW04887.1 hypothetical protein Misp01_00170 [Microtetraspora sp. NBRC 13810]
MSSVSLPGSPEAAPRDLGRGADARIWLWPALAGPVLAMLALAYAHVVPGSGVSPLSDLTSDYALHDATRAAMLVCMLTAAMSCLWIAYGLTRTDPAGTAAARVVLTLTALALTLTAIFPTDAAPGVTSLDAQVHRWAAAVVLTGPVCAGWALSRRRTMPLRGLVRGTGVTAALLVLAFLGAHPGSPFSVLLHGPAYYGLLERLLLVSETALVFFIALSARPGQ